MIVRLFRALRCRLEYQKEKFINTLSLLGLPSQSFLFVKMSVIWKRNNIIPYNYGDDINVFILESLTKKRILKHNAYYHLKKINYLCIGSIIESHCNKDSIIWGSGAMYGDPTKKYKPKKVCALRGPLTKQYLESFGVNCPDIYGDPALLLPLVYKPSDLNKEYCLGIIPHYVDHNLPHVQKFREQHPEVLFINMQDYSDWHEIIDKIVSCECIASSSLHGMIISDAYNIPNVQIICSDKIAGGDFKFRDYCAGVQREYQAPINCKINIDLQKILDTMKDYKNINFDSNALLNACPLPIDKHEIKRMGGGNNDSQYIVRFLLRETNESFSVAA